MAKLSDAQNKAIFYEMMYDIEKRKNKKLLIIIISTIVLCVMAFLFYCI